MKGSKLISVIILLAVMAGCDRNKQAPNDLITVDINATYPEKELILQDFMDVEYIPLETTDEFITQGIVKAIGKDILVVANRVNDGNIFIYDKAGKGIRKINRFGQGGEEYPQTTDIILDEDNEELFIKAYSARKIMVYDLLGNFKRSFPFIDTCYYDFVFNYDRDNLIAYKTYLPLNTEQSGHVLIAKKDGNITREIPIPFKEVKTPKIYTEKMQITPHFYLTTPSLNNWVLTDTSSDTIYTYSPNHSLHPLIVRTPSIQSMEHETFLFLNTITDKYYFMYIMKKGIDLKTMKGYPGTDLLYDKQEKAFYKYTLYNDDYSYKRKVSLNTQPGNPEIATWYSLDAFKLTEAYEKGELKGRLKEIVATLDEEANPVIMLVKHPK